MLHRVVASTWIRPLTKNDGIVFIDGDPFNVAVGNLKIVTALEARCAADHMDRTRKCRKRKSQLDGELWRTIPGFELYQLSNRARIKSFVLNPPVVLKKCRSPYGGAIVYLTMAGRRTSRSVAGLMREVWPELLSIPKGDNGQTLTGNVSASERANENG